MAAMKWCIIADFFESVDERWLDDFIADSRLEFQKIKPSSQGKDWHAQRFMHTGLKKWLRHFKHAMDAFSTHSDGIITCFPQLAMCAGLLKRLYRSKTILVAYNFNVGTLSPGLRRRLARYSSVGIDRFIVHSPSEIDAYAKYFNLPHDRFRFIPLQRPKRDIPRSENLDRPYALAMGSAHRDYETLVEALETLRIPTIIVTRRDIIERLPRRPWIEYRSDLSETDCFRLMAAARLSITPISNLVTASGQVTFVDAMRMGVPIIATRCPGTEGYVEDGETGILVRPFAPEELRRKIELLWTNKEYRDALGNRAEQLAEERFSDQAASAQLKDLLLEFF